MKLAQYILLVCALFALTFLTPAQAVTASTLVAPNANERAAELDAADIALLAELESEGVDQTMEQLEQFISFIESQSDNSNVLTSVEAVEEEEIADSMELQGFGKRLKKRLKKKIKKEINRAKKHAKKQIDREVKRGKDKINREINNAKKHVQDRIRQEKENVRREVNKIKHVREEYKNKVRKELKRGGKFVNKFLKCNSVAGSSNACVGINMINGKPHFRVSVSGLTVFDKLIHDKLSKGKNFCMNKATVMKYLQKTHHTKTLSKARHMMHRIHDIPADFFNFCTSVRDFQHHKGRISGCTKVNWNVGCRLDYCANKGEKDMGCFKVQY